MTVVYLDLLILLNFVANYLLLLAAARLSGRVIHRPRLMISAALGAGYAALPFLGFAWLAQPVCKIASGVLMSVISFGREKGLLRVTLVFFGASAALGGMVWAAELLGGHGLTLENGVLYSWVDIRLLLLLLILCYGVLTSVSQRMFCHRSRELVPVKVRANGRDIKLIVLLDTGNTLTDPATNRAVLVVEGRVCRELLPMDVPLNAPVEAMERLSLAGEKGFCLLPYRAVGVESGLLLAMRTESVAVGDTVHKGILMALSPTAVSDGGGYQGLIGGTAWTGKSGSG